MGVFDAAELHHTQLLLNRQQSSRNWLMERKKLFGDQVGRLESVTAVAELSSHQDLS